MYKCNNINLYIMKTKLSLIPSVLLMITILFSCNHNNTNNSDTSQNYSEFDSSVTEMQGKELVYYLFPTPNEIFQRLQLTKIDYNPLITSPPENIDKFLTFRSKALNLGVYITDMAYSVIFERYSNAIKYLETIQILIPEVNISTSTFEDIINRSENNITSRDSLLNISNAIFPDILEYLEDKEMRSTIALISAGAYIEAMYIALNTYESYPENNAELDQISELKFPISNLLEQARSTSNDPNVKSIEIYLLEINDIFNNLSGDLPNTEVKKESSTEISLLGENNITMDKETFVMLKERINEIRKNITKN